MSTNHKKGDGPQSFKWKRGCSNLSILHYKIQCENISAQIYPVLTQFVGMTPCVTRPAPGW